MEAFGTKKAATMEWRAKMTEALLAGKKDITDFAEATGCTEGTCRSFANWLVAHEKATKTFHHGYYPPVCFVPMKAPHNEYEPTETGRAWLEAELARYKTDQ